MIKPNLPRDRGGKPRVYEDSRVADFMGDSAFLMILNIPEKIRRSSHDPKVIKSLVAGDKQ